MPHPRSVYPLTIRGLLPFHRTRIGRSISYHHYLVPQIKKYIAKGDVRGRTECSVSSGWKRMEGYGSGSGMKVVSTAEACPGVYLPFFRVGEGRGRDRGRGGRADEVFNGMGSNGTITDMDIS